MLGINDATRYRLQGVIVHTGKPGAAHYTAYVRDRNNIWFYCDDARAPRPMHDVAYVMEAQPYMLFYER